VVRVRGANVNGRGLVDPLLDPLYPHPQFGKATVSPSPSLLIAYLHLLRIVLAPLPFPPPNLRYE
jgi:hypothetical protein